MPDDLRLWTEVQEINSSNEVIRKISCGPGDYMQEAGEKSVELARAMREIATLEEKIKGLTDLQFDSVQFAYLRGRGDRENGRDVTDCPYHESDSRQHYWGVGYFDQLETENQPPKESEG